MCRSCYRLLGLGIAMAGLFLVLGCAKPSVPAKEFVGVWAGDYGEQGPPAGLQGAKLALRGDGKGAYRTTFDPHEQAIMWTLRGDEFVFTLRSGALSTVWKYHFDDPDHVVFTDKDGNELKFRRQETESEQSGGGPTGEQPPSGGESASPEVH